MPRTKAIAIHDHAFKPAFDSAKNLGEKLIDLMYGTEERVKLTYAMALALLILGISMQPALAPLAVCAQ
ncbi:MAG: hypothetical protein ACN2B6_03590 [Rickettsiales bacterium]